MTFKRLHSGYFIADSETTSDQYVIRTRPKNDGWMAINDTEGIVLATGQTFVGAMECCKSYDKLVNEATEACTCLTAHPDMPCEGCNSLPDLVLFA
jgi:hypothetical protein